MYTEKYQKHQFENGRPVFWPRARRHDRGRGARRDGYTASLPWFSVPPFEVISPFKPAGASRPRTVPLADGVLARRVRYQTLLGITGSGKTATIAWTIEPAQRPTLVIEPNKSLAAQLAAELQELLPEQPGRVLRLATTTTTSPRRTCRRRTPTSRRTRRSTTRSTGCATPPPRACAAARRHRGGVGVVHLRPRLARRVPQRILAFARATRSTSATCCASWSTCTTTATTPCLTRGPFRVRGDTVELHPVYEEQAVRIELFGDEVERIRRFDPLTGDTGEEIDELVVFPATHYVAGDETMAAPSAWIETELRSAP